jgi:hypothetical protein
LQKYKLAYKTQQAANIFTKLARKSVCCFAGYVIKVLQNINRVTGLQRSSRQFILLVRRRKLTSGKISGEQSVARKLIDKIGQVICFVSR